MEEKILINSKRGFITKVLSLVVIIIGFIAFSIIWPSYWCSEEIASGNLDYVLTSMLPYYGSMTILPAVVVAAIVFFGTARCSMTITDKRVFGKAAFGKRVDLPMDSVSAVATSALKGLAVATSSGRISFFDIANQEEMHKILSDLLIERQDKQKNVVSAPMSHAESSSSADELKKYKDLLDSGVISQEEFDEKKKQLLGL